MRRWRYSHQQTSWSIQLSILYLRCNVRTLAIFDMAATPAFNSLFEMPLTALADFTSTQIPFNSLFEMQIIKLAVERCGYVSDSFNSLFEMPVTNGLEVWLHWDSFSFQFSI